MAHGGALRRASTPVDHLIAEMAAMPLASEASLELAITRLEPWLPDRMSEVRHGGQVVSPAAARRRHATAELWRRAERDLLQAFPAVSLDELVAVRDMLWFPDGAETAPTIGAYLRELASMFLESRGASLSPTLPRGHLGHVDMTTTSAASRRTLRWLTLAIPPDLLCAAAARGDDALELALTNPTLDRMLREGKFAEPHLHLGAAVDFNTIWHMLVANIGTPEFRADALTSPGAGLDEGRLLAGWLIRASVARLILAWYLRDRVSGPARGSAGGRRWVKDGEYRDFDDYLAEPANWERIAPAAIGSNAVVARVALDELVGGSISGSSLSFAMLQYLYRRLTDAPVEKVVDRLADVPLLDPLARIFAVPPRMSVDQMQSRSVRTPEQRFVGRAMRYIERHPDDIPFAILFWQVVRVRCLAYRHFVQRPMTPGLQWFVRFYARSKPARTRLGWGAYLDSAAELDGKDRGLVSLEVRRSPDETLADNLKFAAETAAWATRPESDVRPDPADMFRKLGARALIADPPPPKSRQPLEVGIVLHFTKDRGGGAAVGLPSGHWTGSNADPSPRPWHRLNTSGLRYSAFYVDKRAEAVALARTLQRWPRSLFVIRGLDVCTDELGVPSWVIKPLLERVRSAAALSGTALDRLGEGPAPPLNTTIHAGEDFVHLATGLRGVDEAIEHLGLREGDRIGHGMALGVDATAWANRIGRVAVPREVRMWDLLWEWTWIASTGGGSVPRHSFIEREISRLTEMTFGQIVQPYELELLRSDLLDLDKLWKVGWPHGDPTGERSRHLAVDGALPASGSGRRLSLLYRYLSNPVVFQQGRRVEWIDPSPEADAIEYLQDGLRRKVASMGLTVEINPTSNLLIGDLGSITEHPMWRLNPPVPDPKLAPVAICVGSDDPLMFASSLVEEYNVLYDGLMEAGLTDAEARRWLEEVRSRGLESRFTWDRDEIRPIVDLPNPLRDYPSQVI